MNNVTDLNEYRKRKNMPQFIDMATLQRQAETQLERHMRSLAYLNMMLNSTITTVKEWER